MAVVVVSPIILLHLLVKLYNKDGVFVTGSHFLSLLPGRLGSYLRIAFYRHTMTHCSPKTRIGFATLFSQTDTEIEDGVYIGSQCNIGSCRIGQDSLIASGVHITSGRNQHNIDKLDTPIQQQGGHYEKISIGEDCWIGNCAVIMANVGDKSIIGAGAVVVSDIPSSSVAVGNPATVIKSRK